MALQWECQKAGEGMDKQGDSVIIRGYRRENHLVPGGETSFFSFLQILSSPHPCSDALKHVRSGESF